MAQDNCDGMADGVYTSNVLPITRNSDGSGQCVLYQLTVKNLGASAIGRFNFYDYTPEAMVMSKAPSCTTCEVGSLTAPALGQPGAIKGSIAAIKIVKGHWAFVRHKQSERALLFCAVLHFSLFSRRKTMTDHRRGLALRLV